MFSEKVNKELTKIILDEIPFSSMTEEEILDNITLLKQYLDKLKSEYIFRVHMENGLESYDDITNMIKIYLKIYKYILIHKETLKNIDSFKNLNVKDLNDNEEYKEKYLLNIPNKVIPAHEKIKTR